MASLTSTCSSSGDRVFGPRVDPSCRAFDFTLLFEDILFTCLPTGIFFSLLPFHITALTRSPAVCSVRSKLLLGKLATLAGILAAQVVLLVLRSENPTVQTSASLTADALAIVGTGAVAWLSYIDHQRSLRPSTVLGLYLSVLVILDVARVRTLWMIAGAKGEAVAITVILILTVAALLFESVDKRSSLAEEKRLGAPEEYSGLWIRTAFTWLVATFRAGYKKVIDQDDLPVLDTKLRSSVLRENLVGTWGKYDHEARYSLLKACFHANMVSFLSGVPPRLCKTVFYLTQPLLISTTVSYVADSSADVSFGRALIGAWGSVYLGIACSTALFSYQTTRFITRVKGGLIGLIYQETMKARTVDLGKPTSIALMGTDVERIGQSFESIHEIWASVIEIAVAIWLLERQVFLACLAPVAVILISVGITVPMSNSVRKAQVAWIERVQERLRVTTAMLDEMKAVKMLGLSGVISDMIQELRQVEIQTSKDYRRLLVWNVLLSECPQNISPLATFAVYVIISLYWKNTSLLTAQAFTAISLINLLTGPVIRLVQIMPALFQSVGSFERIQEYCNYTDESAREHEQAEGNRDGSSISLQPLSPLPPQSENDQKYIISLKNSSFTWDKSKAPFLRDIELSIPAGSVTACIGPVGSGKTMLLESILGETICSAGLAPKRISSVAYCAQQPWLENGSIRRNIVGALQHDSNWYKTVKSVCGLNADLLTLGRGDETVVGSKGLNLSGGQKQRIALARAVYARENIVILDDVFSGMDAHTVDLVSRRLLGKIGLFRKNGTTVVMATHNQKLVGFADNIVVLEGGRIVEAGSSQALLSSAGYLAKFGLNLLDEGADGKHADEADISREESSVVGSLISVPRPADEVANVPDTRRKNSDWLVYSYYFARSSYKTLIMFILSMAVWVFCTEFATVWLDWWSEANEVEANTNVGMYMGVYAFLCIFGVAAITVSLW